MFCLHSDARVPLAAALAVSQVGSALAHGFAGDRAAAVKRGKKCLTLQNASNAELPPGIDKRHLRARGKPILVSAIYFADGTLATALSGRRSPTD